MLSLSPTLELLATTHANYRGIYLWATSSSLGTRPQTWRPLTCLCMPSYPCWLQVLPLHP